MVELKASDLLSSCRRAVEEADDLLAPLAYVLAVLLPELLRLEISVEFVAGYLLLLANRDDQGNSFDLYLLA